MSLQQWLHNSWIALTQPSAARTADLLAIANRELADASLAGISPDGRFDHAYAAVRALCELALQACGYGVPKGTRQHERIIESLKLTLDGEWSQEADYFDRCRRWRHQSLYDRSGVAQQRDADELLSKAKDLLNAIEAWLRQTHPELTG